ncbi:hypothetical protein, partial [Rhizobium anhuiense]|uniref:hypothetical protein n=1 Tax=Rhizobium anhuiense TaxID=1184720 RepID=UPI001AECC322
WKNRLSSAWKSTSGHMPRAAVALQPLEVVNIPYASPPPSTGVAYRSETGLSRIVGACGLLIILISRSSIDYLRVPSPKLHKKLNDDCVRNCIGFLRIMDVRSGSIVRGEGHTALILPACSRMKTLLSLEI